jgi:flagellar basal-body rod protein FlgG
MFRSLHIAATGMQAQESQLDTISNNLANSNTVGFKKVRADFQDLFYQNVRFAGTQTSTTTMSPTGLQIGSGVRMVGTSRIDTQGAMKQTGNNLDLAIEGAGYFVVTQPDGTQAFTRSGQFKLDAQGRVTTPEGLPLDPPITVPPQATSVSIGRDGTVSMTLAGQPNPTQIGSVQVASFVNPAGLNPLGHNLFQFTMASGDPQLGVPGVDGRGTILQGAVEQANVEVVEEMIGLIAAQRAYEVNSKVISAADDMLKNATNLR